MKRMLLAGTATLMAAAAFAAPAPAQDFEIYLDDSVACTKPVVECARDLAVWAVNTAYGVVIAGGDIVDDVCDRVFGTCNTPTP